MKTKHSKKVNTALKLSVPAFKDIMQNFRALSQNNLVFSFPPQFNKDDWSLALMLNKALASTTKCAYTSFAQWNESRSILKAWNIKPKQLLKAAAFYYYVNYSITEGKIFHIQTTVVI